VSRLVARLYHQLGVSAKDSVVEVQKGDLVAGYVNQTAMKTAKKIKEARGGILFVDEAYQLTQALQRGQSDFSGEAIDEMMKVMNETGRKSVTFVFAGYKKEMDEFVQYNAGLESRIKCHPQSPPISPYLPLIESRIKCHPPPPRLLPSTRPPLACAASPHTPGWCQQVPLPL